MGDLLLRILNSLWVKALVHNRSVYLTNLGSPGNIGMTPKSKVQILMMMLMPQRMGRSVPSELHAVDEPECIGKVRLRYRR